MKRPSAKPTFGRRRPCDNGTGRQRHRPTAWCSGDDGVVQLPASTSVSAWRKLPWSPGVGTRQRRKLRGATGMAASVAQTAWCRVEQRAKIRRALQGNGDHGIATAVAQNDSVYSRAGVGKSSVAARDDRRRLPAVGLADDRRSGPRNLAAAPHCRNRPCLPLQLPARAFGHLEPVSSLCSSGIHARIENSLMFDLDQLGVPLTAQYLISVITVESVGRKSVEADLDESPTQVFPIRKNPA